MNSLAQNRVIKVVRMKVLCMKKNIDINIYIYILFSYVLPFFRIKFHQVSQERVRFETLRVP